MSQELTVDEKLTIIGEEYHIPIEENFRKDVSIMCNLSQGIEERGIAIGEERGEAKIIVKLYENGFTLEQIATVVGKEPEDVKAILSKKEPTLM